MVDWTLARQIARFAARSDDVPALGLDLPALAREIEPDVIAHARLQPAGAAPSAEVVGRGAWAEANLSSLSTLLEPVTGRLEDRLARAGPFAGALRLATGVTVAAEVGLVVGYMSQRVLGQYELALLAPDTPPRLLFVAANLERAVSELDVDQDSFLRWVVIHELTHALQFGSVPWLRGHLGGLLREYLETVDVRIERGAAGGLPSLPNPTELVERFKEGGLAALVQTQEQRAIVERMQAAMALIEGHAEHVMDALAPKLVPEHEGLREAMSRRRASRSAPERILGRLLGMDMKLRQYELGKSFCDAVVAEGGIEALNRAWTGPPALPTREEIEQPVMWLGRTEAPAAPVS
ncbi:MAG TPA: zinc-dependent metalloprotease [Thermoleophilaceae bacterium]|nr:zinc-dependent metalloprotease [Thermoleophilaceae bacterium]